MKDRKRCENVVVNHTYIQCQVTLCQLEGYRAHFRAHEAQKSHVRVNERERRQSAGVVMAPSFAGKPKSAPDALIPSSNTHFLHLSMSRQFSLLPIPIPISISIHHPTKNDAQAENSCSQTLFPIILHHITTNTTTFPVRTAAPATLPPSFFSATNAIEGIISFVLPPSLLPSPRDPGSAPLAPTTRISNVSSPFLPFYFYLISFHLESRYICFVRFLCMRSGMEVAFRIVCLLLKFLLVFCVRDQSIHLLPSGRKNLIIYLFFYLSEEELDQFSNFITLHVLSSSVLFCVTFWLFRDFPENPIHFFRCQIPT